MKDKTMMNTAQIEATRRQVEAARTKFASVRDINKLPPDHRREIIVAANRAQQMPAAYQAQKVDETLAILDKALACIERASTNPTADNQTAMLAEIASLRQALKGQ